jgi:hypothetical protein
MITYAAAAHRLAPDAPADIAITSGALVTFHGDYGNDYEARVRRVDAADCYTAEVYWLWLLTEKLPVRAGREQITLKLCREAALVTVCAASSARTV